MYQKLSPKKLMKPGTLSPTAHTWISPDGMPKPFLGHLVANVQNAALPRSYPVHFYVFKDATFPQILLSYATLEGLGSWNLRFPISWLTPTPK